MLGITKENRSQAKPPNTMNRKEITSQGKATLPNNRQATRPARAMLNMEPLAVVIKTIHHHIAAVKLTPICHSLLFLNAPYISDSGSIGNNQVAIWLQ